mgnify:CR=1 FL=1
MRFLGLDYGDKRIGIAVSDEGGGFAFPRVVLRNTENVFDEIKKICDDEKIEKIVLGVPISLRGGKSDQARKTEEFGEKLKAFSGLRIEYENEVFTSKITQNDASAAALILQSYLDRNNK